MPNIMSLHERERIAMSFDVRTAFRAASGRPTKKLFPFLRGTLLNGIRINPDDLANYLGELTNLGVEGC